MTASTHITRPRERGTVLLTVLLIVAVISALAISVVDEISFGIRRAGNVESRSQARWYALSAEEFARTIISRSAEAGGGLHQAWSRKPLTFPIEGGVVEARIADGSNCFNLNSLVGNTANGESEEAITPEELYLRLLAALGFDAAQARELAATVVDWIDENTSPEPRGAEDFHYMGLEPPYRAANTRLAEPSELRALRGYDEDVYRRVRPFVCAVPVTEPNRINVNTLGPGDAPLLQMIAGPQLSAFEAEGLIAARPAGGYGRVEDFWSQPAFADVDPAQVVRPLVSLKTRFYALKVRVTYRQADAELSSVLELMNTGSVRLVSRHYGAAE